MVEQLPRPDRLDAAAGALALALLGFAYVVYPHRLVQYGAWLAVFCVWMGWFVRYGARWLAGPGRGG